MTEPDVGLFSGFEGYRSTTEDDRITAVREWMVVLDTNVLLGLYQFHGSALQEFADVFGAIGERLFVPHQVIDEFWRNRRVVLAENQGKHQEPARIEKSLAEARSLLGKWYARVVERSGTPPEKITTALDEATDTVLGYIRTQTTQIGATGPDTPTHEDRVVELLDPLLLGRVGPAPSAAALPGLQTEGQKRVAAKVPPGYQDAAKGGSRSGGDYLVWRQTMDEAQRRQVPVLLVTQDLKEDWWADPGTAAMRARPELVQELLEVADQPLLMMRGYDLLQYAAAHLGVAVSDSTLQESMLAADEGDESGVLWTAEMVEVYVETLAAGWPAHLQILLAAMRGDESSVPRAEVAALLGREADAPLTGITRPFGTARRELQARGLVADFNELLTPVFSYYEEPGYLSHLCLEADLEPLFYSRMGVVERLAETPVVDDV